MHEASTSSASLRSGGGLGGRRGRFHPATGKGSRCAAAPVAGRELMERIGRNRSKLLVNISAPESAALALAAGADGVHLAGNLRRARPGACGRPSAPAAATRLSAFPAMIWTISGWPVAEQVDLLLFSPVFEKLSSQSTGTRSARPSLRGGAGHTRLCPGRRDPRQCPGVPGRGRRRSRRHSPLRCR